MNTAKRIRFICEAGIIAALYAVLTILAAPISYGLMQIRISEALCVLPFFTPSAIPGLFVGCAVANIFGGNGIIDVVVGSLATLLSAYITYKVKLKWLAPLSAVVVNAFAIGIMLSYILNVPMAEAILYIAVGQTLSCYVLGMPLLYVVDRYKNHIFLYRG